MQDLLKKNNKKQGAGCGSAILGTLIVIAAVIVYVIVSLIIGRVLIAARFGDATGGALMTFWLISVVIAFVLFEVCFAIWQIKITLAANGKPEAQKMSKVFKITLVSCIALSFVLAIFSANTYTEIKNDSISKVCFVTTEEYRWDDERNDVSSYTFDCDESGMISFIITMKGNKEIDLNTNFIPSENFKKEHVNCLGYAAYLTESFKSSGYNTIEAKISDTAIENAKKIYRDSDDEARAVTWKFIERILVASGKQLND